jgi:hypothetical protein
MLSNVLISVSIMGLNVSSTEILILPEVGVSSGSPP